ncbi:MAG: AMP-binding protein [Rhodospirillaceae bacterium]|nr:AMP-binding protein [Rhodospirillaceae bacterium]
MTQDKQVRPPWFNPATPGREDCVLPCLVDKWAAAHPDKDFIRFEDGATWTWAEAREIGLRTAAALQKRGVKAGDTVLAWLPNGASLVRAWLGANYLGAVLVPINLSYKGRLLEHVIKTSKAKLMISHPALVERLGIVDRGTLERVIVDAPQLPAVDVGLPVESREALDGDAKSVDLSYQPQIWDTMVIIFTSGTTGPSKAVPATYLHQWTTGQISYGYMRPDDRILINLPIYHVGGTSSFMAAAASGGSIALFDAFNTKDFWGQLRATGSTTISGLIGAMTTFLSKNEPHPSDADNPLRICTLAPVNDDTIALGKRYGFDYVSGFNMTELSCPLITDVNVKVKYSCGRPRSGVQCRIVDDNDIEVPHGTVGEFIVRSDRPWDQITAYFGNAEATAIAWRNGWFHTGDLMYRNEDGDFFFVDRKKDAIRRRGENISSLEVEADVASYPAVREVAAYGVPSANGEEEVMITIAAKEGQTVDPRALIEFLVPRMAHYMVPRYVRTEPELPKTPTNKIQKADLRREGVTKATWDREAAGIVLKRDKLNK